MAPLPYETENSAEVQNSRFEVINLSNFGNDFFKNEFCGVFREKNTLDVIGN
jgi:hypothetical protein